MTQVAYLLAERAKVRALGDAGVERAITADLARVGYVDTPRPDAAQVTRVETPAGLETTAVTAPERTVPSRGGRPSLPRCKHGKIDDGRCHRCKTP